MIIRLTIAAAVLYGLFRFVKYVQSKPENERRSYYITLLIGLAAAGLVLLSVTGRVHWLAGLIGGAMPFVRQYVMNHVYKKLSASNGNEQQEAPRKETPAVDMNESQALAILGLKAGASADDIIRAHRSLMQKLHPDRGGNDYLASQLNAAKELLLKNHA